MNYEYEMFFDDDGAIPIHGWWPIATDRIKDQSKIQEYIDKGILRRIDMKEQDAAHSSPISERYETNDDVRLNILINHLERVAAEWPYSNRIFQDREAALRAMKFYAEHELTRLRSELQQKDEIIKELIVVAARISMQLKKGDSYRVHIESLIKKANVF